MKSNLFGPSFVTSTSCVLATLKSRGMRSLEEKFPDGPGGPPLGSAGVFPSPLLIEIR